MTTGKKYDYRIAQTDTGWTAEITRRATSKKTVVSKSQNGFTTEAEAQEWAKNELASLLKTLSERDKLRG